MNKIALISDIHGNYPALKAVLSRLEEEKPDTWICLGDLVGYGPNPSECISEVQNLNMLCVLGNHDAGLTGKLPLKHFRGPNRKLIELSRELVSDDQKEWLSALPLTLTGGDGITSWMAAHASPQQPSEWEYLESAFKMRPMLQELEQHYCFVGHTHRPALVSESIGSKDFKKGEKYFINPGSVGQSRDGDPRASCGILDLDNFTYKNIRVDYKIAKAVMDLESLGFSRKEAEHLLWVK